MYCRTLYLFSTRCNVFRGFRLFLCLILDHFHVYTGLCSAFLATVLQAAGRRLLWTSSYDVVRYRRSRRPVSILLAKGYFQVIIVDYVDLFRRASLPVIPSALPWRSFLQCVFAQGPFTTGRSVDEAEISLKLQRETHFSPLALASCAFKLSVTL